MDRAVLFGVCLCGGALLSGAALAQDIYAGAIYESGNGVLGVGVDYDTHVQSFVGLAGVRFSVSGPVYAGGEIESALSFGYSDDGNIYIDPDGPQRYRAVAGVDLSGFSVFLSAGQTHFDTGTEVFTGPSLGIGVELPLGDRMSVRVEAIQDNLSEPDLGRDYDNQSIRAGAIINF